MGSRQEYHWESDEVLSACAGSVMSDFLTPRDCCPPSSAVHGIFQVRIPEWLAIFLLQGLPLWTDVPPSSSSLNGP